MTWWHIGLLAIALLALATWAHLKFWVARLTRPTRYDEVHRVASGDGSAFELRRLRPAAPQPALPPVLLVHGIAINHRNLDPDERLSLARQLRDDGRDVWLLTLRCGRSDLRRDEVRKASFEALVRHDLPEAAAEVRARSGHPQIDYLGFSMGGMLLYASLGRSLPSAWVRRVVILGSPARVRIIVPHLGWLCRLPAWCYGWSAPLRLLARLTAFAAEWFDTPLHRLSVHLSNARRGYVRTMLVDAVQSIPAPLLRDFGLWAYADGAIRLADGQDALLGLRGARQPLLMIAGSRDHLAPPGSLRPALEAWGADGPGVDKTLIVVGKAHGQPDDYGHGDLAVGDRCEAEVNAPIRAFLNQSDG